MRSQVRENKQSESYPCALSVSLEVRGKGKENGRNNKAAKNRKRKERRKIKDKKRFCNAIESRRKYIKDLSSEQLTDDPVTKENLIRRQLLADFNQFARRMRLQYIFHGKEGELWWPMRAIGKSPRMTVHFFIFLFYFCFFTFVFLFQWLIIFIFFIFNFLIFFIFFYFLIFIFLFHFIFFYFFYFYFFYF